MPRSPDVVLSIPDPRARARAERTIDRLGPEERKALLTGWPGGGRDSLVRWVMKLEKAAQKMQTLVRMASAKKQVDGKRVEKEELRALESARKHELEAKQERIAAQERKELRVARKRARLEAISGAPSEYEVQRLHNIAQNKQKLQMLGLEDSGSTVNSTSTGTRHE